MLAAITGMRRGELFGLKWEDLDFGGRTIRIVRSLVDQIEGVPKTETSRKPLPMSDGLAAALMSWHEQADYPEPSDWVFASPMSFGKLPYWPDMLLRRHILASGNAVGNPQAHWLAYLPPNRSNASYVVWFKRQDDTGIDAPRYCGYHSGTLRTAKLLK
jgi:integrase